MQEHESALVVHLHLLGVEFHHLVEVLQGAVVVAQFLPQDAAELDGRFRNGAPRGIDTLQVMVTVPKRKLRHAVDRVLMRRRIREAYRLHRLALKERLEADPQLRTLSMSIIYIADRTLPYPKVEKALLTLLRKLGAALGHEAPDE